MISLITVVKDDRGIEDTLNTVIKIPKPDSYEIIVVDASQGRLNDIKQKFPDVRWFDYENKSGKKVTISEQRNIGVKNAMGDVITFIDANCIPVENWLIELYTTFKNYGDDIVFGPIIPNKENVVNNIWDSANKSVHKYECPTGNVLINKKVFDTIGYFDEKFSYGEDTDLTWRAVENGYKIRFCEHAIIHHDWGDFSSELKRPYKYGKSRAMVYKKHIRKWRKILYYERVGIWFALFVLFSPIGLIFPAYFLLLCIPIGFKIGRISTKLLFKSLLLNIINGLGIIKGMLFNY